MIKINRAIQINNGTFHQTGRGLKSVRISHRSFDGELGFVTTTYSHSMTDEMKEYAAERINLAMRYLNGFSNDDIKKLIARRESA